MIDIKEGVELAETIEKIGKVADFVELTPKNIKTITNAIDIVADFNEKIESYGKHIFESLFIDNVKGWMSRLSEKDFNKAFPAPTSKWDKWELNDRYVLCYKTMKATKYDKNSGWSGGASSRVKTSYEFKGQNLIVTNNWETQSARFNHIPWIPRQRKITINTQTKTLKVTGENINTER